MKIKTNQTDEIDKFQRRFLRKFLDPFTSMDN